MTTSNDILFWFSLFCVVVTSLIFFLGRRL
jgi:hypothetical protein